MSLAPLTMPPKGACFRTAPALMSEPQGVPGVDVSHRARSCGHALVGVFSNEQIAIFTAG